MKIAGCIIQKKNIMEFSKEIFHATYKGKNIYISSNHGFGKAKYDHLTRFNIEVKDLKCDMLDVDAYEDFHTIQDAIRYALEGACLINK